MALSNRLGQIDGKRMVNPPMYRMENGKVLRRRPVFMGGTLHKWIYEKTNSPEARHFLNQNLIAEGWFNG